MNTLFEEYNNEETKTLLRIGDLGIVKFKKVKEKKTRGITNPRQVALKEIQEIIEKENGAKMSKDEVKLFCIKLSHIKEISDLYFMKSEGLDYRNRTGKPFGKYIYGSIKVK